MQLLNRPTGLDICSIWQFQKLAQLEKKHNIRSVAFELLGPPDYQKLLFEINLIGLSAIT